MKNQRNHNERGRPGVGHRRPSELIAAATALAITMLAQADGPIDPADDSSDAISREFTIHNDQDFLLYKKDNVGREWTLHNDRDFESDRQQLVATREFTFHNDRDFETFNLDSASREFTLYNGDLRIGDVNCDLEVGFDDIDAFVVALVGKSDYEDLFPDCEWITADLNCDSFVDFDDIDAFVVCVIDGGCRCPR